MTRMFFLELTYSLVSLRCRRHPFTHGLTHSAVQWLSPEQLNSQLSSFCFSISQNLSESEKNVFTHFWINVVHTPLHYFSLSLVFWFTHSVTVICFSILFRGDVDVPHRDYSMCVLLRVLAKLNEVQSPADLSLYCTQMCVSVCLCVSLQ